MPHKLVLTTAILMVGIPLAGCGGETVTPIPTTVVLPTIDPSTTVNLTQTVTSEDGVLTVHYPEGWFIRQGISQVVLANDEANFEPGTTPDANEAAISVLGIDADLFPPAADGRSILNILHQFTGQAAVRDMTFGEPEEFTVNGRDTASITGTSETMEEIVMVTQDGDNYIVAILASPVGMSEQHRPVVRAILGSATYRPEVMMSPTQEANAAETPES
jgi:hypothetical protein